MKFSFPPDCLQTHTWIAPRTCKKSGRKWDLPLVDVPERFAYNADAFKMAGKKGKYMGLGNSLYNARKKSGLTQETVAEKLGVSRQTISKWELDETLPDIRQSKKLSALYRLTLDELVDFDVDLQEIERVIEHTSEEKQRQIDWTQLWGKKYPVLTVYQEKVAVEDYAVKLKALLDDLQSRYGYSSLDAMLVLKDILSHLG